LGYCGHNLFIIEKIRSLAFTDISHQKNFVNALRVSMRGFSSNWIQSVRQRAKFDLYKSRAQGFHNAKSSHAETRQFGQGLKQRHQIREACVISARLFPLHQPIRKLWAATDQYISGKYTSDGVYDPNVVDRQLGRAALSLRRPSSCASRAEPIRRGRVGAQPTTHAYNQISKATRHNATITAALPQFHLTDCHHSMGNIASSFDCFSDK
jgi:hypothetical protein